MDNVDIINYWSNSYENKVLNTLAEYLDTTGFDSLMCWNDNIYDMVSRKDPLLPTFPSALIVYFPHVCVLFYLPDQSPE